MHQNAQYLENVVQNSASPLFSLENLWVKGVNEIGQGGS